MGSGSTRQGTAAGGRRGGAALAAASAALWLSACAAYHARPLAAGPDLASGPARLSADISKIRLAPLKTHPFDPAGGLDPTDVAVLAVLNSPDLVAKRAAARIDGAQAFAAGLLPDPQVALSADFPVNPKGLVTAYAITPTFDVMSLVTRSTALKAARASARQADLDLLWSEWSTAQQARGLAVTILADEAKSEILRAIDERVAERYRQSALAFQRHDLTAQATIADLAAKLDADTQLATAVHDGAKARGDLNALIGLAPGVRLNLVAGARAADPTASEIEAAIAALPSRRPDLLALQAGYASQDANLRKSILSQFPLINLGYSRQRDTSNILTNGLAATLVVPIFNRGRGDIAVQSATRERLAAEYQARLDQTIADVAQARRDLDEDRAILARLERETPRLATMAGGAPAGLERGDLDSATFLALEQAALKAQVAIEDTRLARAMADIALQTVLFIPSDERAQP